jgi:hypothetical protein
MVILSQASRVTGKRGVISIGGLTTGGFGAGLKKVKYKAKPKAITTRAKPTMTKTLFIFLF